MEIPNRLTLMKAHALLAAFIFPVATMFLITGALYTWGIKGDYNTTKHELHLAQPIQEKTKELVALAEKELEKHNISIPTGTAKIKRIGNSFRLEWTGSNMDINLEPTVDPLIMQLEIKNASLYRQFVQLHKAKGGTPFKVYAAVLSISIILLLISGFIMAWKMPKLRKLTLASSALGILIFAAMFVPS